MDPYFFFSTARSCNTADGINYSTVQQLYSEEDLSYGLVWPDRALNKRSPLKRSVGSVYCFLPGRQAEVSPSQLLSLLYFCSSLPLKLTIFTAPFFFWFGVIIHSFIFRTDPAKAFST
jgi:hypothetical protein